MQICINVNMCIYAIYISHRWLDILIINHRYIRRYQKNNSKLLFRESLGLIGYIWHGPNQQLFFVPRLQESRPCPRNEKTRILPQRVPLREETRRFGIRFITLVGGHDRKKGTDAEKLPWQVEWCAIDLWDETWGVKILRMISYH